MAFSPELFLSNLNGKEGLAKPSRFDVFLPIPPYINNFIGNSFFEKLLNLPNIFIADITNAVNGNSLPEQSRTSNTSVSRYLSMQCETAELPGKSLLTSDAKIYGPTFKVPYQTQYSDMNLTFLCTNEFYERKLFDRWIEAIMPTDTNNLRYAKENSTRYLSNIKVVQYDEFIREIFAIELIDAFPIAISPQPLSWSEDTFHRLTVQFAYQKYRVVYQGNYDVVAAASSLFGIKFADFITPKINSAYNTIGGAIDNVIERLY